MYLHDLSYPLEVAHLLGEELVPDLVYNHGKDVSPVTHLFETFNGPEGRIRLY